MSAYFKMSQLKKCLLVIFQLCIIENLVFYFCDKDHVYSKKKMYEFPLAYSLRMNEEANLR